MYKYQSIEGTTQQVSGSYEKFQGIGIHVVKIEEIIIPLYLIYFMTHNPQNSLSTTAIKKYNEYKSVRIEALEYLKLTEKSKKVNKNLYKQTYDE